MGTYSHSRPLPKGASATAWQLQLLSPRLATVEIRVPWSRCSATRGATAVRSLHAAAEGSPLAAARERPMQQRGPAQPGNRQIQFKKDWAASGSS